MTNHPTSVFLHCWLGHQTCKTSSPVQSDLNCVEWDVKSCSTNQPFPLCGGSLVVVIM